MFPVRIAGPLLAVLCLLTVVADASAFGRKPRAQFTCCTPCLPCPNPCQPCHLAFSLHAGLYEGGGLVPWSPDRPVRLPVEIGVTNWECYPWTYTNSEYRFLLFDDRGCWIPNAFIYTMELRTITVIPRATVLDRPNVFVAPGVLQLGKRYTVVVTLRGRSAYFHFTPVLFGGQKG